MRIGALARAAGTTARTVRYYEEIGLLPSSGERVAGEHREYDEADVARLQELLRLKGLLGLSLDELRDVMAGEEARVQRRRDWQETSDPEERQRLLGEGLAHTDSLLELVRRRAAELETFEAELRERRQRQAHLLRESVV
ncbi:MAG TPA: MerR family transcriptional regulator [Solirubrobacter sp.]|nr:MerR family transcriptional regulator [Solirubrobacter sp.]